MNVLQEEVDLPTGRGSFAATIFGKPDDSAEVTSKFRPVAFLVHGAGMNKEGFNALAKMMVVQAAGHELAAPPVLCDVIQSSPEEARLPGAISATPAHGGVPVAPPTAPPKKSFPKPGALSSGVSLSGGPINPALRQVTRGGPTPLQSGPGLFDPAPGGGGGRSTDSQQLELRVVTLDLRGHGKTKIEGSTGAELSREVFLADTKACIQYCMATYFPSQRFFYLMGHSLGGSLAAHLAHDPDLKANLGGLVLLDIVEDTAKQSLVHMDDYLDKRPDSFQDPKEAVKWMVQKGGMRNLEAAAITVPTLLRHIESGAEDGLWRWRTDLRATKPHWEGWFEGMDDLFITVSCPKVLCLANTSRLDTKLTTAHMQGKFQFEVIGSHVGHYLMEDDPSSVAVKLCSFLKRVEALSAKLPASMLRPKKL